MPEGHSIHRFARLHTDLLGGRVVAASSPQGRFSAGAAELDGTMLQRVDALGKHLFYRFARNGTSADDPELTLHVHLGLFGRFRQFEWRSLPGPLEVESSETTKYRGVAAAPTLATRLVLTSSDAELQLAGPTICELIAPAAEAGLRARLGPDPLHGDDPSPAFAALRRRSAAIGQVLLDQQVIAGIGNVYRAEVLFLLGVHPDRSARDVDGATCARLWALLRKLMTDGERRGRIITVQPQDRRVSPSRLRDGEYLYVYNRGGLPCRRCGTPIVSWELGGRMIWACPVCQPA